MWYNGMITLFIICFDRKLDVDAKLSFDTVVAVTTNSDLSTPTLANHTVETRGEL